MKKDYLARIRECANTRRFYRFHHFRVKHVQLGQARHYRGKYNGNDFEPFYDLIIGRTVPRPRNLGYSWGGQKGGLYTGECYLSSKFSTRFTHILVYKGKRPYWFRNPSGKILNTEI